MADEPIYSDKNIFEHGAAGMVATLALAANTAGAPLPVQGAIAMVGSFVGFGIGRFVYRAAHRRFPKFALGFLRWYDPDPEKAQQKAQQTAEERKDEPTYHEVVYRSFRQMMDAADESVTETLGYLAGMYSGGDKKPDQFFRGLGKVLCDLEVGELEELKTLLRTIEALNRDEKLDWLDVVHEWREKEEGVYEPIVELVLASSTGSHGPGVDSAPRLFMLLKRETLARNKSSRYEADRNFESGDQAMYISAETLQKILGVIDPWGEVKIE